MVNAGIIPTVPAGTWRTMYIAAIDDTITVLVDDQEVLNFTDPDPLPGGEITVNAPESPETGLIIDDFSVWISPNEIQYSNMNAVEPADQPQQLGITSFQISNQFIGTDTVFYVHQDAPSSSSEIYSMDGDGGNQHNWGQDAVARLFLSPDGNWVIYTASSFLNALNLNTGSTTILLGGFEGGTTKVAWKPDSSQIAFSSNVNLSGQNPDLSWDIFVADFISGSPPSIANLHNVTNNTDTRIVFSYPDWGNNGLIYAESVPVTGERIGILYGVGAFVPPTFSSTEYYIKGLSWSPNGAQVAYAIEEHVQTRTTINIFYFNTNNGTTGRITNDQAGPYDPVIYNTQPDWSIDNGNGQDWIFFQHTPNDGTYTIRRISLLGDISQPLGNGNSFGPSVSNRITTSPLLRNKVIPFDINQYSQTNVDECPGGVFTDCSIHISVRQLIENSLQPSNTLFTHGTLIEILVYNEYLTTVSNGSVFDWANEALARRFYTFCGEDGCLINQELYVFLSYYSSAYNQDLDIDYEELQYDRNRARENPGFRTDIENNLARLDSAVELIIDTPPSGWTLGTGEDLPFGFATASCIATDPSIVNIYAQACGVATSTLLNTSSNPSKPNGNIFFGTTISTDGVGICVYGCVHQGG